MPYKVGAMRHLGLNFDVPLAFTDESFHASSSHCGSVTPSRFDRQNLIETKRLQWNSSRGE
jgi:hypothetical protein